MKKKILLKLTIFLSMSTYSDIYKTQIWADTFKIIDILSISNVTCISQHV